MFPSFRTQKVFSFLDLFFSSWLSWNEILPFRSSLVHFGVFSPAFCPEWRWGQSNIKLLMIFFRRLPQLERKSNERRGCWRRSQRLLCNVLQQSVQIIKHIYFASGCKQQPILSLYSLKKCIGCWSFYKAPRQNKPEQLNRLDGAELFYVIIFNCFM